MSVGVREDNAHGLSLYRRMGFTQKGRTFHEGSRAFHGGASAEMELCGKG